MASRRAFLKAGGIALFAIGIGGPPLFLRRTARAAVPEGIRGKSKTLIAIFQRGAMDGLMAVTPYADPYYLQARPRLALGIKESSDRQGLIDLDGRFGLHPALHSFKQFYDDGRLAIVHGVGSPDPTRSHFDAQDYMESGTPGHKETASGWLNRAMGQESYTPGAFRAVSMTPVLPRSLYGDVPALAIANIEDTGMNAPRNTRLAQIAGDSFESLYAQTSQELLHDAGSEGLDAARTLSHLDVKGYKPANGAEYPVSPLGSHLKQICLLIKANVGVEVAFAECGGWDNHIQEGTLNGNFARPARDLALAVTAFWQDLGQLQDDVVLMTMTEFGRTVRENGSGGTDHGRGSCMFLLGNDMKGGRVYGTVPVLAPENLEDGRDLPVTTDFRTVFSSVAVHQFGAVNDALIFPGWTGTRMQIFRS